MIFLLQCTDMVNYIDCSPFPYFLLLPLPLFLLIYTYLVFFLLKDIEV